MAPSSKSNLIDHVRDNLHYISMEDVQGAGFQSTKLSVNTLGGCTRTEEAPRKTNWLSYLGQLLFLAWASRGAGGNGLDGGLSGRGRLPLGRVSTALRQSIKLYISLRV